jgi:hypothetical protein
MDSRIAIPGFYHFFHGLHINWAFLSRKKLRVRSLAFLLIIIIIEQ